MPPLGSKLPAADRISHGMGSSLLVLSNGHGEDLIALRVIQALRRRRPAAAIAVLPLVGEGEVFSGAAAAGELTLVGPRQPLPSGGFSNQSLGGLLQDLGAGLAGLSWRQWRLVGQWGGRGRPMLAVGDLLPLLLAWSGGGPFGFIGTPKSDYTWASPVPAGWGRTPLADRYHRCKGSEWDPWEWQLMASSRCRLVAVRDPLTARGLRRQGVPAVAAGNPMTDGFSTAAPPHWLACCQRLVLLPGSRMPEALGNASRLLESLQACRWHRPTTVLVACGRLPDRDQWAGLMAAAGLPQRPLSAAAAAIGAQACWGSGPLELLLGPGCFQHWASWGDVALATAGTATEQMVGLGIPALSLPGPGPQFQPGFARRQSRLLGGAVVPCHSPAQLAERLEQLLHEPALRRSLGHRGRRRMGAPGGSDRLAGLVEQRLLG